jgi:tetratricopeptide (TPR) repeat protein
VISRWSRLAPLALAAALAAPRPATAEAPAGGRLEVAERQAGALDDRLSLLEVTTARPDETPALRARRKFTEGETQFLLGDWLHAAILMLDAVEQPEFRTTGEYVPALAYLGDALRLQGACGAALPVYDELLAMGPSPSRGAALTGALDCRVKLRRQEGLEPLLAAIPEVFPSGAPPEVAYLVAKSIYFRTDLRPAERLAKGLEAFAAVPPPYHLAAAYFEGVLQVEAGELAQAATRFERCVSLQGKDAKQSEIRELCVMALGRVYAELGQFSDSLDRYQAIPRESDRFNEALYEIAWNYVRAKEYDQALRTASMIVDLAPESHLAPEATILTGHLNLQLGRYADATESFNRVINNYAPVRDEIDAILTMHEDPVRYFNELIGRQGKAFDVAAVLPSLAVKWATAQKDVSGALDLVQGLQTSQRDLEESNALAARLEALLARGGGLDAAPLLLGGWASAEAVRNDVARLRGEVIASQVPAGLAALSGEPRAELERVEQARAALQARVDGLPRTPEDVQARRERMLHRVDAVSRQTFQLRYLVDSGAAAVAGTEAWLEQHRAEISSDEAGRAELSEELRRQRTIVLGYQEDLKKLDQELAGLRDEASGSKGIEGEAQLRRDYAEAVDKERAQLATVRPFLPPAVLALLDRCDAVLARLARSDERAGQLEERLAAEAQRRAEALQARVAAERTALGEEQASLDAIGNDAKDVIGRIAFKSFSAVRAQFYRLVLKADVGIVDVAWSRKRERLEKIQQLSVQKAAEIETLERDFKLVLREVE